MYRRWIVGTFLLTAATWLEAIAVLLAIANRVHSDIPAKFAAKLPLMQLHPDLIFAGDSRTHYQVDPSLAAEIMGKPNGAAVNIAYEAGEPLAVRAAIDLMPSRFLNSHVVINITPPVLNDGLRTAGSNPQNVTSRMGVLQQMSTFLPLRLGTLIRFVREAFNSRLAISERVPDLGPQPENLGLIRLATNPHYKWPADLSSHAFYAGWDLTGPKVKFEIGALCEMARHVHRCA